MDLSSDLISQFAKITNDDKEVKSETTLYGTIVEYNGKNYVKIDGSDQLTPVSSTTVVEDGDRVIVTIKNHSAIVTGNTSSPSASNKDVIEIGNKISEFEIVIADKVSTTVFDAQVGRIDELVSDNATIKNTLTANEAQINTLTADNVTINEKLTANEASIDDLETTKLDVEIADAKYATVEHLEATNADIYNLEADYGDFKVLSTNKFEAVEAEISGKLSAKDIEGKYANIDFSNISEATMEQFYANSGLIKNVEIGDAVISGELVGVTISGDLIEGNTIVAEKLVIKGEDGLYYKLNTDGVTTEAEQTDYNSLNGSVIKAKSVTAEKINVNDLVAFGATIGGFKITTDSLYSGVKESVDNTTRGIYMDNDGQIAIGDSSNFIKYYKDTDGTYRLSISAESLTFTTSGKSVEEELDEIRNEVTTSLAISSSRGTVFKNDNISTVLTVAIYRGSNRITDMETLRSLMGDSVYLQWSFQRFNEETFYVIDSSDSRISNEGFTFSVNPDDVDASATFLCELIE